MHYNDEIEKLNKKVCCKANKFYNTFGDFPTTGKENTLYIDKATVTIYIWDGAAYITKV